MIRSFFVIDKAAQMSVLFDRNQSQYNPQIRRNVDSVMEHGPRLPTGMMTRIEWIKWIFIKIRAYPSNHCHPRSKKASRINERP